MFSDETDFTDDGNSFVEYMLSDLGPVIVGFVVVGVMLILGVLDFVVVSG